MSELYWYASRATGLAATVLLTGVFVLGLVSSARHRPHGPSQTVVAATHRSLALGTSAFLLVHVVTAVADSYVPDLDRYVGQGRNPVVRRPGPMRVRRGGSFDDPPRQARSGARDFYAADLAVPQTGFRLVMEP